MEKGSPSRKTTPHSPDERSGRSRQAQGSFRQNRRTGEEKSHTTPWDNSGQDTQIAFARPRPKWSPKSSGEPQTPQAETCRFFAREGWCRNGKHCWFSHDQPELWSAIQVRSFEKRCDNCFEWGHLKKDCPEPRQKRTKQESQAWWARQPWEVDDEAEVVASKVSYKIDGIQPNADVVFSVSWS